MRVNFFRDGRSGLWTSVGGTREQLGDARPGGAHNARPAVAALWGLATIHVAPHVVRGLAARWWPRISTAGRASSGTPSQQGRAGDSSAAATNCGAKRPLGSLHISPLLSRGDGSRAYLHAGYC